MEAMCQQSSCLEVQSKLRQAALWQGYMLGRQRRSAEELSSRHGNLRDRDERGAQGMGT